MNASARDSQNNVGAYEGFLRRNPVTDPASCGRRVG